MIKIREAIIVEGKYDKIKLSSLVDAVIIETHGFGIFKDKEQMALIRRLAAVRGILVLTDSDGAGFVIRSHLSSCIPPEQIKHAYIPDILGKERRKAKASKEGKLGVEGLPANVLLEVLERAGVTCETDIETTAKPRRSITKADLFEVGLTGGADASAKRRKLLKQLDLPEHLSANAMLSVLNAVLSYEDFLELLQKEA